MDKSNKHTKYRKVCMRTFASAYEACEPLLTAKQRAAQLLLRSKSKRSMLTTHAYEGKREQKQKLIKYKNGKMENKSQQIKTD